MNKTIFRIIIMSVLVVIAFISVFLIEEKEIECRLPNGKIIKIDIHVSPLSFKKWVAEGTCFRIRSNAQNNLYGEEYNSYNYTNL